MWHRVPLLEEHRNPRRTRAHLRSSPVAFAFVVLLKIGWLCEGVRATFVLQHKIKVPIEFNPAVCPNGEWSEHQRPSIDSQSRGSGNRAGGNQELFPSPVCSMHLTYHHQSHEALCCLKRHHEEGTPHSGISSLSPDLPLFVVATEVSSSVVCQMCHPLCPVYCEMPIVWWVDKCPFVRSNQSFPKVRFSRLSRLYIVCRCDETVI
jgi:hypothetical protein